MASVKRPPVDVETSRHCLFCIRCWSISICVESRKRQDIKHSAFLLRVKLNFRAQDGFSGNGKPSSNERWFNEKVNAAGVHFHIHGRHSFA
ncbi:hypothetical protein AVEN_97314-1 [Araneus ventricosus]|uniref:Uncharacterized protein n=1 Tax=Araneus ventricosus TaxID=182803 RepID=A0A4Y2HPP3_ARAVE|nr:hypothetical protein AVEN_97314-1 [Araneus ventricosus]